MGVLASVPTEVWTGIFSALVGGWLKLQSAKEAHFDRLLNERLATTKASDESAEKAVARVRGTGGEYVRRYLAVIAGSYIFLWPAVLGLWQTFTDKTALTTYLYNKTSGGFWFFTSSKEDLYSALITGYVITPLHTHLATAVFFFYFGAGIVKSR